MYTDRKLEDESPGLITGCLACSTIPLALLAVLAAATGVVMVASMLVSAGWPHIPELHWAQALAIAFILMVVSSMLTRRG